MEVELLSKPEPQCQSKGNHFPEKKKKVPHRPEGKKEVHVPNRKDPAKTVEVQKFCDKKSRCHSIMLFAKDMTIIWSDDSRYWKWISVKQTSGATVEVAELLDVCWLEIKARIDTKKLCPGIPYQAGFVVMMKDHAYGWTNPVKLGLLFPNGSKKEVQFDLKEIGQRNEWVEIRIGESFTLPKIGGELELTMVETGGHWKKGLVVKAVVIRPKKN